MPVPASEPREFDNTCQTLAQQARKMSEDGQYDETTGHSFIHGITNLAGVLRPEDRQKLAEQVKQLA